MPGPFYCACQVTAPAVRQCAYCFFPAVRTGSLFVYCKCHVPFSVRDRYLPISLYVPGHYSCCACWVPITVSAESLLLYSMCRSSFSVRAGSLLLYVPGHYSRYVCYVHFAFIVNSWYLLLFVYMSGPFYCPCRVTDSTLFALSPFPFLRMHLLHYTRVGHPFFLKERSVLCAHDIFDHSFSIL